MNVPTTEFRWLPQGLDGNRPEAGARKRVNTGKVKSRRVIPGRLAASGFQFRFAKLEDALRDIERGVAG